MSPIMSEPSTSKNTITDMISTGWEPGGQEDMYLSSRESYYKSTAAAMAMELIEEEEDLMVVDLCSSDDDGSGDGNNDNGIESDSSNVEMESRVIDLCDYDDYDDDESTISSCMEEDDEDDEISSVKAVWHGKSDAFFDASAVNTGDRRRKNLVGMDLCILDESSNEKDSVSWNDVNVQEYKDIRPIVETRKDHFEALLKSVHLYKGNVSEMKDFQTKAFKDKNSRLKCCLEIEQAKRFLNLPQINLEEAPFNCCFCSGLVVKAKQFGCSKSEEAPTLHIACSECHDQLFQKNANSVSHLTIIYRMFMLCY